MDKYQECYIVNYPAEILCQQANPVNKIEDDIRALSDRMIEIMLEEGGIGLAAPQVGVPLRLFVISLDSTLENTRVYVNPILCLVSDELEYDDESCLSIPDFSASIGRFKECEVTAIDSVGKEFTERAEGLKARCLQHEYDHLEGKTLFDYLTNEERTTYLQKVSQIP